jgi:CPA2 family monovalent cation:H+ antiporter-2
MEEGFLGQALVYLGAAVLLVPLARRLGLGSVLGYLLAGVLIGPYVLGFVGSEGQDIMHVAEFGVVMMLFLIGLELEPSMLWRLRLAIAGLGGLQVATTALVTGAVFLLLGYAWNQALALGLILGMSSTAIVLQTIQEKGLTRSAAGQNAFAVLLFQDIAVIPILALLPLLALGAVRGGAVEGHASWISTLPGWAQTLAVLAAVALIVLVGRTVARPLFRMIAATRLRELFTATALLLVVGITVLMTEVGLSPALGTFVAGVVLANSEYRHELEGDIEPFKGLLLGLFFIAVGATIDFGLLAEHPGTVAGLVLLVMGLKATILLLLGRFFGLGTDQRLIFAASLAQVGEFAFVLLSYASQHGVLQEETVSLMMAVVACTMALTSLVIFLNERLLLPRLGTREEGERKPDDAIHEKNPVIIAGFGRFGNIVGRFLRANGVGTTVLDVDSDRVEVLRKLGLKVYYGDASRHELLNSAGAGEAKLIVIALDTPEKTLQLVETIRKHFPHLRILARAYDRSDTYELMDRAVDHVYRETLDSSLQMGVDALKLLGHRAYRAHRAARTFKRHDERALGELAGAREDRIRYLSLAREHISALERLMLSDLEDKALETDKGWDIESLRDEVRGLSGAWNGEQARRSTP